jgi:glycine cleavage system transcriptional repressor
MTKLILSVLGHDRPGIIAAVSGILFENGGNIEAVSQTILQTQFSGTFIVAIPESLPVADLRENLEAGLNLLGLDVLLRRVEEKEPLPSLADAEPFVITTQGPDQKGLVAQITAIIARHGVNVTNLQAIFKGGDDPESNIMIYEVDIPKTIDRAALYADLRQKAEALSLSLNIQHRRIFYEMNRI